MTNSEDFLIAEFSALQDRARHLEDTKSSRVNFFLVLIAATVAGFSSLLSIQSLSLSLNISLMAMSLILLLIGLATLNQTIQFSIAIVTFYRKAGRIRRWFVEKNPELNEYVAFKPNDDSPSIYVGHSTLTFRGGDGVILIMNSALFTLFCMSLFSIFVPIPNSVPIINIGSLISVVVFFVLSWYFQKRYIIWQLRRAEKWMYEDVHFPYRRTILESEIADQEQVA